MTHAQRLTILLFVAIAVMVAVALSPRVSQPLAYHHFADTRALLGVPNALNVLSNLPFLIVGAWGTWFLIGRRGAFVEPIEHLPYLIFFLGVALTCFGSGYYHLAPDNDRLVWDRLPMTIAFTALFAALLGERVGIIAGLRALPIFLLVGASSVGYWIWTEHVGRGDLRPYLFVQFFPILAIPLLISLFPPRYTRALDFSYVIGFYLLAKVLEFSDAAIFTATRNLVSGHSLKHLAAAVAVWFVLRMLEKRQPN
ncbi:MAG TPA: hypothetical protein VM009_00845 [Terriglobales bacterium]|nr:hypothetical protein [Terriglobales bacterium]